MNENKKIVKKYNAFLPSMVTSGSFRVSFVLVSTTQASALLSYISYLVSTGWFPFWLIVAWSWNELSSVFYYFLLIMQHAYYLLAFSFFSSHKGLHTNAMQPICGDGSSRCLPNLGFLARHWHQRRMRWAAGVVQEDATILTSYSSVVTTEMRYSHLLQSCWFAMVAADGDLLCVLAKWKE
jgi:hypothetical protein